jgi:hypothetical protein
MNRCFQVLVDRHLGQVGYAIPVASGTGSDLKVSGGLSTARLEK